eukprot:SAG11_NODE_8193_length_1048_cov_7.268704_1_plen_90_part_00
MDPEDGNAYTCDEFIDQYGGTAEWEAAAPRAPLPAPVAATEEKRVDPEDGVAYTRAEFIEAYVSPPPLDPALSLCAPNPFDRVGYAAAS